MKDAYSSVARLQLLLRGGTWLKIRQRTEISNSQPVGPDPFGIAYQISSSEITAVK